MFHIGVTQNDGRSCRVRELPLQNNTSNNKRINLINVLVQCSMSNVSLEVYTINLRGKFRTPVSIFYFRTKSQYISRSPWLHTYHNVYLDENTICSFGTMLYTKSTPPFALKIIHKTSVSTACVCPAPPCADKTAIILWTYSIGKTLIIEKLIAWSICAQKKSPQGNSPDSFPHTTVARDNAFRRTPLATKLLSRLHKRAISARWSISSECCWRARGTPAKCTRRA